MVNSSIAALSNKYLRVLPIGLSVALSLFGDLSLFAGLVTQLEVVHLTLAEVGVILSVHRLVRIPGNLVVGYLQDRLGRRGQFVVGMVLAVLSTAAYGLVSGFWPFVLARVTWGAAWALLNVCGTTMVLDLSGDNDRGGLTGFYAAWIWMGYIIGPLAGGLLTDALSFQRAMLICSLLSAAGLLVALIFVRVPRFTPDEAAPRRFVLWDVFRQSLNLRRNPPMLNRTLLTFVVVQFAGDGVVLATLTLLLTQRLGPVISLGGTQLSAAAAGGIFIAGRAALACLVSLGAGRLSDTRIARPRLVALGLAVGAAGAAVLAFAGSPAWIILGLGLGSLASGAVLAVLPALVRDYTPGADLGRSMGGFAMVGDIGSSAGPALAFALAPVFGLGAVYGLCAGLFLISGWGMRKG
jgi:MFS family permease